MAVWCVQANTTRTSGSGVLSPRSFVAAQGDGVTAVVVHQSGYSTDAFREAVRMPNRDQLGLAHVLQRVSDADSAYVVDLCAVRA